MQRIVLDTPVVVEVATYVARNYKIGTTELNMKIIECILKKRFLGWKLSQIDLTEFKEDLISCGVEISDADIIQDFPENYNQAVRLYHAIIKVGGELREWRNQNLSNNQRKVAASQCLKQLVAQNPDRYANLNFSGRVDSSQDIVASDKELDQIFMKVTMNLINSERIKIGSQASVLKEQIMKQNPKFKSVKGKWSNYLEAKGFKTTIEENVHVISKFPVEFSQENLKKLIKLSNSAINMPLSGLMEAKFERMFNEVALELIKNDALLGKDLSFLRDAINSKYPSFRRATTNWSSYLQSRGFSIHQTGGATRFSKISPKFLDSIQQYIYEQTKVISTSDVAKIEKVSALQTKIEDPNNSDRYANLKISGKFQTEAPQNPVTDKELDQIFMKVTTNLIQKSQLKVGTLAGPLKEQIIKQNPKFGELPYKWNDYLEAKGFKTTIQGTVHVISKFPVEFSQENLKKSSKLSNSTIDIPLSGLIEAKFERMFNEVALELIKKGTLLGKEINYLRDAINSKYPTFRNVKVQWASYLQSRGFSIHQNGGSNKFSKISPAFLGIEAGTATKKLVQSNIKENVKKLSPTTKNRENLILMLDQANAECLALNSVPQNIKENGYVYVDNEKSCRYFESKINDESIKEIGVDIEDHDVLSLIQISTSVSTDPNQEIFILDCLSDQRDYIASIIKPIFEDLSIIKVLHDGRRDGECLKKLLDIELKSVVDVQVVNALIEDIQYSNPTFKNKIPQRQRIGFNKLMETHNVKQNDTKTEIHQLMDKNSSLFKERPLSKELLKYAADDVISLLDLKQKMIKTLQNISNEFVIDLSTLHCKYFNTKNKLNLLEFDEEGKAVYTPSNLDKIEKVESNTLVGMDSEFKLLLEYLPPKVRTEIVEQSENNCILEIEIDDEKPIALLFDGEENSIELDLEEAQISDYTKYLEGHHFSTDNRTGIPGTLHRISRIQDLSNQTVGLTYRIGRHIAGGAQMMQDLVAEIVDRKNPDPPSILLLGRPGSGKTTLLRDLSKLLGDKLKSIVVDTSGEIGGFNASAHKSIGKCRRMHVPKRDDQHKVLLEAVQNHGPRVIIIDEISNPKEVKAAKTIGQRGVCLIGTAHGKNIQDILKNPEIRPLVGGIETVTIGDAASKSNNGKKTKIERAGAPTFQILIEIQSRNKWKIHHNVAKTIDCILSNEAYKYEKRWKYQEKFYSKIITKNLENSKKISNWLNVIDLVKPI